MPAASELHLVHADFCELHVQGYVGTGSELMSRVESAQQQLDHCEPEVKCHETVRL